MSGWQDERGEPSYILARIALGPRRTRGKTSGGWFYAVRPHWVGNDHGEPLALR